MTSGPSELRDYDLKDIYNEYHWRVYHEDPYWWSNSWRGVKAQKHPSDLIMYAEIIHKVKPDVLIETGCAYGGSTLFFRDITRLHKPNVRIFTVDLQIPDFLKQEECINTITGSSTSDSVYTYLRNCITEQDTVMVVLDSDHTKDHVLEEMERFGPLVTKGSYMVVEDTNINGNPVFSEFGPGPKEAVTEFLKTHSEFSVDASCERLGVTFHPGGWLVKK